jgi:outer membrane lipoprotein-sorting protein
MHKSGFALVLLSAIAVVFSSHKTSELTAEEILSKAEKNLTSTSTIATLRVTASRPKWSKTITLKTWNKGTEYAAAYILAPEKDKGTVYVKSKNEVWNYLPKINKTVKLPANLMSQNWMGTDLSTDDLVRLSNLTKDYTAKRIAGKTVSGRDCYGIQLDPKPEADVLWGRLKIYIDKEEYLQLQTTFYDEDLEVVNVLLGGEIKNFNGVKIPSKFYMVPAGKKGMNTKLEYLDAEFNVSLEDSFFSKDNLPNIKP